MMQHDAPVTVKVDHSVTYGTATYPPDHTDQLTVVLPQYPNMTIREPLPWADRDQFNEPRHFRLFASLRWLYRPLYDGSGYNRQRSLEVLDSFLTFFIKREKKRWRGMNDHAAANRLRVLCSLYEHSAMTDVAAFIGERGDDLHTAITEHARFIMSPEVYREKHNHGLICALVLFQSADIVDTLEHLAEQAAELVRQQIEHIFDPHGFAREHSMQYQWFNSNRVVRHVETLQRILGRKAAEQLSQCAHAAKIAMMTIGELRPSRPLPLGDTTTNKSKQPSDHRPRDPGHAETVQRRLDQATQSCLIAPEAGFFLLKNHTDSGDCLLSSFSCVWHGHAHKQNDECSFTVAVNGEPLIADPGYSRVLGREVLREIRSERAHSTVWSVSENWSSRHSNPHGSTITAAQCSPNVFAVQGEHRRLDEVHCQRVLAVVDHVLFFIVDMIDAASKDELRRSFTLGSMVKPQHDGSAMLLDLPGSSAELRSLTPMPHPTLEPARVLWDDTPFPTQQVVYRVHNASKHHVNLINLQPQRIRDVSITIETLQRMQVSYSAGAEKVSRLIHLQPISDPCYVAHDGDGPFAVHGFERWRSEP